MAPYLITYAISIIFAYIASIIENKILKFIFCILSIAPLVILAGIRDMTIGGDTSDYPWNLYNVSYTMQYVDMLSRYSDHYDFLFVLGTAYVSKTFRNFNVVLGSYQLFMSAIFICYMYKEHPKSIWIGVLTYNTFIFQLSLTIIRQILAYSVLLVSFYLSKQKRPILFLASVGIAYCFHRTALLGLFIYPLFVLFRLTTTDQKSQKFKTYLSATAILVSSCLFVLAFILKDDLIRLFALTKESYQFQVDLLNQGKFSNSSIFMLGFNVFSYVMFADRKTIKLMKNNIIDPSLQVTLYLTVFYFFLSLFSLAAYTLQRIAMGFIVFFPLFFCLVAENTISSKHRNTYLILLITFSMAYTIFLLTNAVSYQTVPYTSEILTSWIGIKI